MLDDGGSQGILFKDDQINLTAAKENLTIIFIVTAVYNIGVVLYTSFHFAKIE